MLKDSLAMAPLPIQYAAPHPDPLPGGPNSLHTLGLRPGRHCAFVQPN